MTRLIPPLLPLVAFWLTGHPASAADDAEILSRRVPNQRYYNVKTLAVLDRGKIRWGIPLWACDPADLTITKVLGRSAPAPYAIKITLTGDNRIDGYPHLGRLRSIHLLAASLEDAVKMRRALVTEIAEMQRKLETRQGNAPGYLKQVVQSNKR